MTAMYLTSFYVTGEWVPVEWHQCLKPLNPLWSSSLPGESDIDFIFSPPENMYCIASHSHIAAYNLFNKEDSVLFLGQRASTR